MPSRGRLVIQTEQDTSLSRSFERWPGWPVPGMLLLDVRARHPRGVDRVIHMFQTRLLFVALIAAALAVLPALSGDLRSATAQSVNSSVSITDAGFEPSSVTIGAGESIQWTNQTGQAQSVTAEDGLFDSGPIPPGRGFTIAVALPGDHPYPPTT